MTERNRRREPCHYGAGQLLGWLLLCAVVATTTMVVQGRAAPSANASIPGGINVEPSMRPWRYVGANPQSWWCVQSCVSDPIAMMTAELTDAHVLGARNVRLEFPWYLLEPQPGVFNWSRADAIMSQASTDRVTIQPVLMWTPAWAARIRPTRPAQHQTGPPSCRHSPIATTAECRPSRYGTRKTPPSTSTDP